MLCSWVVVCMLRPNAHTFLDGVMGATLVLFMVHETINKTTVASRNGSTFSKKKTTLEPLRTTEKPLSSHFEPPKSHVRFLNSKFAGDRGLALPSSLVTWVWHFQVRG